MLSRRNLLKAIAAALLATTGGLVLRNVWRRVSGSNQQTGSVTPPLVPDRELLLSFFLLSDIHMSSSTSAMAEKLHQALADITNFAVPVQAIVLGGDLVDGGREEDYRRLGSILAEYKLPPLYGNMGNHEYYDIWYNASGEWSTGTGPNGKTDAQARERFLRFMGQERPYRDIWINGVHLILLSQEAYVEERPEVGEGAWYSDEQMAWFEERMREHADGRPAFVFIHQPLPAEGQDGGTHRLIRAKEFRRILAPYRNVFILSGHTHRSFETDGHYVQDSAGHWITNASVGRTRGASSVQAPAQGLYIQVYADQVLLLGREFSNRTWITNAEWKIEVV